MLETAGMWDMPCLAVVGEPALPTALLALARTRSGGQRVLAILDPPAPVPEPAEPAASLPTDLRGQLGAPRRPLP